MSAEPTENLVVLRTPPGAANFLASAIDHGAVPDVLGTIAGTSDLGGRAQTDQFTDEVIRRVKSKLEVWSTLT